MLQLQELTTLGVGDAPMFAAVVLFHGIYRYCLTHGLLMRLAKVFRLKAGMKFVHRAFDMTHYTFSAVLGILALIGRPYSHCVYWGRNCSAELLPTPGTFICTFLEKLYYLDFCAYYVVDILFIKTVPHDIVALLCHHLTTLSMIAFAVVLRVPVIGLVQMLLHDIVDVPLYIGKVAGYLGWRLTKDVSLLTFAAACTWFRMINFPILVVVIWRNLPAITYLKPLYTLTASLLLVLYGLHIYWYRKIARAVMGIVTEGDTSIRDNRSD
jgi:hypothetical protein